jgi:hypothetical protein
VTAIDAGAKELARRAADKRLPVEASGDSLTLVIPETTPEAALAKLGLFTEILASRT